MGNVPTRTVVVLGSTGSIGTQALEVVAAHPGAGLRVVGLAAGGGRLDLLAAQALDVRAEVVGVARHHARDDFEAALRAEAARRGVPVHLPKVLDGPDAPVEVAAWPSDVVLNGMTGSVGLGPTLAALDAGRVLALANKESLVAGGPLVHEALRRHPESSLVPVDSEHSALAQCLRGGRDQEVRRLLLTASGGPFRGRTRDSLTEVTPQQALAHPTWTMGPVVTINSATLMNKGLEVIEAHELFGVPYEQIDVVVHPQSVVHSMVEFTDGSTLAQASPPDMRLPIALALTWPERLPGAAAACDWTAARTWEFQPLEEQAFPAVQLAKEAGRRGGVAPAVLNAANEECVAAFLAGRAGFLEIVDTVARVVEVVQPTAAEGNALSVGDVLLAEREARRHARHLLAAGGRPATTSDGS